MSTQLAPKNVFGRDKLIERIWRLIKKFSVVFTAERRIGKTTVMQKMQAEAPEGNVVTYLDLEKVDSPCRFVEVLLEEVNNLLPKTEQAKNRFKKMLGAFGGTEIAGVVKIPELDKSNWQSALEKTIAAICEQQKGMVIFLFDELPYMLQKIAVREKQQGGNGDHAALAILDSLRAMRAEHSNLRMVFAGSIGLHHVIDSLRGADFASQPFNEMETVEIGPLDRADASALAVQLLQEEKVECACQEELAGEIVELTDRVPFYIERVIMRLAFDETLVTPARIQEKVQGFLTSDSDDWEMEHFRRRIPIYYPGTIDVSGHPHPEARLAMIILDMLAIEGGALSIDQVYAAVKARISLTDRQLVIDLLRKLYLDHYLTCDDQKRYSFRFPLIKQWWIHAQGLTT